MLDIFHLLSFKTHKFLSELFIRYQSIQSNASTSILMKEEQSDQGHHCLPFGIHHLSHITRKCFIGDF